MLDALAALEVVEMLDDDAAQLCWGVLVGVKPGVQQCHTGFDAAFTRYVDAEVEHAAHVAQRHADRVLLPVFAHARHGLSHTGGSLPGGCLETRKGRAQVVIG